MASSTQSAVSDGTLAVLDISIDYLSRSEISVLYNGFPVTSWSWVGTTEKRITFSPNVPVGTEVLVMRTTAVDTVKNVFSAGAAFIAKALDEDFTQVLHVAQEARETNRSGNFYTDINMHGRKLTNVGLAQNPTDAVTLSQHTSDVNNLNSSVGSLVNTVNVLGNSKVDKVAGKQLSTEDYTSQDKTKLQGIATGATKNSTDAELRLRTNHTGVQSMSTIEGLQEALLGLSTTTYLDGGNAASLYTPYQLINGGTA